MPGPNFGEHYKLHDPTDASIRLDEIMTKALKAKVSGKKKAYQVYKNAGWRTLLVLELIDFQLSSLQAVGESFRRVCPMVDLTLLDYVVLTDQFPEDFVECCWAFRNGEIRSAFQQATELSRLPGTQ